MGPLIRKISLTQGLVVVLVFVASGFAMTALADARARADHLHEHSQQRIRDESLEGELRDIEISRPLYFFEKRGGGQKMPELRRSFYESLDGRIAPALAALIGVPGGTAGSTASLAELRRQLAVYRAGVAAQELALRLGDEAGFEAAAAQCEAAGREMRSLARALRQVRQEALTAEIEALRQATRRSAALALVFSGVALLLGIPATLWLTRSIMRPVRSLRAATEALSRGEFDRRLSVRQKDELGDLARSFNEMAARLQELDQLKGDFVSMVSHDLKTPLTSVKEAVDLLSEGAGGDFTPRQRRLLSITRDGVERLTLYVQGILDMFRFEAGRIHLVRDPLDLVAIVREQVNLVEVRCRQGRIHLSLSCESDPPPVEGDRPRLAQIVANLLDNAIKFTPSGGRITVSTGVEPWKDDLAVVLRVSDSGVGIAPRDLKHVFDRFFQATPAAGQRVRGAGLGLAIVRALVEAHEGEVLAESALGRGTTFTVRLPAAERLALGKALAG